MNKFIYKIVKPTEILFLLILLFVNISKAQDKMAGTPVTVLQKNFQTPPDSVKPSVYWYWLSDNISKEGVTKDLESMAKVGIGRAFIGNIGLNSIETAYGNVKLFTDKWWDITEQAIRTAGKVGIDIGMFNSPGWSQSGGPWVKPSQSMRYLAGDELHVKGPQQFSKKLVASKPDFQDVAVLAFPAPSGEGDDLSKHAPTVSSDVIFDDVKKIVDGDLSTASFVSLPVKNSQVATINIKVADAFTARSIVLYPATKPFKADCELQVNDGDNYRTIKKFEYDRTNPALNVGFMPYAPVALSFAETQGKQFRLILKNMSGTVCFAEIRLSAAPYNERYEEKQLAKMFQTPLPLWNEYQWTQQAEPNNKFLMIDPGKVINITKSLLADGTFNWDVPEGEWIIIRYGMLPTGVTNSPATPEGRGYEVDKMNKQALVNHFDSFIGKVLKRMPVEDRKAFKYVVADSYETGSQNWTDAFAKDFQKQYSYNPIPWLPALTGRIVGSADQSDRFLWDIRRLVADKVAYDYVGGLRDLSHQHGLKLWLENYGHWGFPSEFLKYGGQSDEVGGEFWNEGTLGSIECKAASSAAHIYGKTKVSAESFTAGGLAYARYPALLKKRGDWSFTEGINNTLLHVFIEQPYEDKSPGMNAWFGTEFNRKNTWFYQGGAFIDYIRRCNYLLQQGKPVNDVAYFIGEDAPKMTGIRDPELPAGYSYDYINAEVIENMMRVKDGRLVLPDGMSYRILVLPQLETMRPELLHKIKNMVREGGAILGPAPNRSPSLQNYPAADQEVKTLAAELWGNIDGKNIKYRTYGKGVVFSGMTMQQALDTLKVHPDFFVNSEQPVLYTHRSADNAEIYFVTNQSDQTISFPSRFRVTGKQPEWWDAVTGEARILPQFTQNRVETIIPIKLESYQSGFVIFRYPVSSIARSAALNFPEEHTLTTIKTPWVITFDKTMRGPEEPVVFNELKDWTKHEDERIKNYSGTAIYKTSFNMDQLPSGNKIFLNLGEVNVMANVKLNGNSLGTVWTAPWQIDVSAAIKQGINQLEITVVNTWVNRLIGDSRLPEAERKTWTNINIYTPESKYQLSGLVGPVTIRMAKFE